MRGDEPGALLCPVNRASAIDVRRMTGQAVLLVCKRRAAAARIAEFSPHDLRRTFIGDLLDRGADVSVVQQLAGHANVTTTVGYDRRPETVKRAAAELLIVPWTVNGR